MPETATRAETAARYDYAKDEAARILRENLAAQPPIDVFEIARNEGLSVAEANFSDEFSGVSGFIDLAARVVRVNALDGMKRQKFTVAHELGHWVLHRDQLTQNPDVGIFTRIPLGRPEIDPREKEANCFAANLLVPDDLLAPYRGQDTALVAAVFGVSVEVINYRFLRLKDDADG